MAYGECCQNCVYGNYDSRPQSIGANKSGDVWCDYQNRWVGTGGRCSNYEPKE